MELVLKMTSNGIISNAQDMKSELADKLKRYNYVVNEDTYEQAKSDKASLNKLKTRIEDTRKQFEGRELVSWNEIKRTIMDCEKMIKTVSDGLNEQIKALDEQSAIDKMNKIEKQINLSELLPKELCNIEFIQLYDFKTYSKKSMTIDKIIEDIENKAKKLAEQWSLLKGYIPQDDYIEQMTTDYFQETLDATETKAYLDDLIEAKKRAEAKKRETEQQIKQQDVISAEAQKEAQKPLNNQEQAQTNNDKLIRFTFAIDTNQAIRNDLNALIKKHRPQYKILNKEEL